MSGLWKGSNSGGAAKGKKNRRPRWIVAGVRSEPQAGRSPKCGMGILPISVRLRNLRTDILSDWTGTPRLVFHSAKLLSSRVRNESRDLSRHEKNIGTLAVYSKSQPTFLRGDSLRTISCSVTPTTSKDPVIQRNSARKGTLAFKTNFPIGGLNP